MKQQQLRHVAIIPDGNRRWAKEKGLPTVEGHRRGFNRARELTKAARDLGIEVLTLWAFSTENWKRSQDEVGYLMQIYEHWIDSYLTDAIQDEVKLVHIGRKDRINKRLLDKITQAEEQTKTFTRNTLVLALDYGGQDEILRAINKIRNSKSEIRNLEAEDFSSFLDTKNIPDPDLIIRTSGEQRTSGFLLWQAAYAEYLFVNSYFPDFTVEDFTRCINEYKQRQRRFGK